jgi:Family of unknown function (DUF6339)
MPTELKAVRRDARVALSAAVAESGRLPTDWENYTEVVDGTCDLDLLVQLSNRCADLIPLEQMDPWLAPRLHCAFRIPRSVAANEGMWTWLALHCARFVQARFAEHGVRVNPWRYNGVWSRNALSRLWWGAEMTRNGEDYSATVLCFSRVRTAQFALELMYSWDRAAAIAFSRVAENHLSGGRLSDERMKELSKRLKVYLTLRGLNGFGDTGNEDSEEFDAEWAGHRPSLKSLLGADIKSIKGPSSGRCSPARIDDLITWFRQIVIETAEAPQAAAKV